MLSSAMVTIRPRVASVAVPTCGEMTTLTQARQADVRQIQHWPPRECCTPRSPGYVLVHGQQRVVPLQRLRVRHVQRGARDDALSQRDDQRVVVHQHSAADIN